MAFPVLSHGEVMLKFRRYVELKHWQRPVGWNVLAELSGLSLDTLGKLRKGKGEMSDRTRVCLSRAFHELETGQVQVYRLRDGSRAWRYRREPRPMVARTYQVRIGADGPQVKVGLVNKGALAKREGLF